VHQGERSARRANGSSQEYEKYRIHEGKKGIRMKTAKSFQDVGIWQKAHQWVLGIYKLTANFPKHEQFGLTSQLRRAAVSVPANFAEGFRKESKLDKVRFYNIGQVSIAESQYYLILAKDLGYADTAGLLDKLVEIDVMLDAYVRKIRREDR
jgi:four helix bundle protein